MAFICEKIQEKHLTLRTRMHNEKCWVRVSARASRAWQSDKRACSWKWICVFIVCQRRREIAPISMQMQIWERINRINSCLAAVVVIQIVLNMKCLLQHRRNRKNGLCEWANWIVRFIQTGTQRANSENWISPAEIVCYFARNSIREHFVLSIALHS